MGTNIFLFVFCFDFCCRSAAAEMRAETTYKRFANPSVSFADTSPVRGGKGDGDTLYNSRARARIFADLLKGYL